MHVADDERAISVFISYRREGGFYLAKTIHDDLKEHGYDVFMDVRSLGAGQFERATLDQVRARDCFVVVLTKGSLDRCRDADDWLRKEILTAREADRAIVPVLDLGFSFDAPEVQRVLAAIPGALREITGFNAVRMPPYEYVDSGLDRLRTFLHGTPTTSAPAARTELLKEAERQLESLDVPSASSLTRHERSELSWSQLQDRLLPSTSCRSFLSLPSPTLTVGPFGWLKWTAVEGETEYVLERDESPEFESPRVAYAGPLTSYGHFGRLVPRGEGYYRVKAQESPVPRPVGKGTKLRLAGMGSAFARESEWSNVARVEPVVPGLPAPTLSHAGFGTVTWTGVTGASGYLLQRDDNDQFPSSTVVYQGTDTSFMDVAPILRKADTFYRVRAQGTLSMSRGSDWSNVLRVAPQKLSFGTRLPAPTLTRAGVGKVQWSEVTGASGYVLERDDDDRFTFPIEVYKGAGTSWFDVLPFTRSGELFYRVKATSASPPSRDSAWSDVLRV
jgi:hypothetical protein